MLPAAEFILLNSTPEIPEKWCVRRTPENAEVLNAWVFHKTKNVLTGNEGDITYHGSWHGGTPDLLEEVTFEQWQTIPEVKEWLKEYQKSKIKEVMHMDEKAGLYGNTDYEHEIKNTTIEEDEQYGNPESLGEIIGYESPSDMKSWGVNAGDLWIKCKDQPFKGLYKWNLGAAFMAGEIVETWKPVYREKPAFKVGDWVVWLNSLPVARQISGPCRQFTNCWSLSCEEFNSCHEDYLRHATPEEIEAARPKEIWEKYPTWESLQEIGGVTTEDMENDLDYDTSPCYRDVFPTVKHAEAAQSFAMLSQIEKVWNEGKKGNWIVKSNSQGQLYTYEDKAQSHIKWASEELALKSIELHGDLWRKYWMV